MNDSRSGLPKLPLQLNALQLLGLREPATGDLARLRGLQFGGLHSVSLLRAVAFAAAGIIVVALFRDRIDWLLLGSWFAALLAAVTNLARLENGLRDTPNRGMSGAQFTSYVLGGTICTAVWAYAFIHFAPRGSEAEYFALCALVAMLMAGTAITMASAPLMTVIFALGTGFAGAVSFALMENWHFAIAGATFACLTAFGALQAGRTFLTARIAEAGVAEKDEVVSLLLREFEENEADWLWHLDTNRRVKAASPRFAFALGREPAEIDGESFIQLVAGESWDSGEVSSGLRELADLLKRRENFANLIVQVQLPGGRRWWELSGTPMRDERGTYHGFRGVGSDVTERRESDEKIAYLARYDTLTGLPNRLMLTEALGEALRYGVQWKAKCAFLMIDLDRFKAVNDSLGHQVGDRLLARVSQRLRDVVSAELGETGQCGRLGGDEFAVVMRDIKEHGSVKRVAEAIIAALSEPYNVDNNTLFIGASVGSAVGPRDGVSVEMLMRNADLALYRAKDDGGCNTFAYVPALHANAEERRNLELSLREAIGKNEMLLHFQPVVDANSEEVVSFEALLRWNSPEHGFVSPGKFIPLAEDTRLIVPIGQWVLHEACREAVRWPDDIKIAVNVSGEQLLEPGFSRSVVRALADTGLPARRLEVEVTESVFLRDGRTARQTLEEIMALGCAIALDDFGTGYSSLGYLRSLRFSTIKVDRSFVQGAAQESPESLAIIRAVVAMADSLDMSTTAEGVEDAAQARMIREMGCKKIQGYYFGRPMPIAEADQLVMGRQAA